MPPTSVLQLVPDDHILGGVDALHELIQQGVPFRDAYVQIGEAINKGDFVPPKMANPPRVAPRTARRPLRKDKHCAAYSVVVPRKT